MSPKKMVGDRLQFIFPMNFEPMGRYGSLFDHKRKMFFRQSCGSRIYLRQTYPSNSLPVPQFLLWATYR